MDWSSFVVGLALTALGAALVRNIRPRLNIAAVYLLVWGPLLLVQGLFRPLTEPVSPPVLAIIGLAALGTVLGLAAGVWWRKRRKDQHSPPSERPISLAPPAQRLLMRIHVALLAVMILYVFTQMTALWPYMQDAGGLIKLFTPGSGAATEYKQIMAVATARGDIAPWWISALNYVLYLGNASVFTGALLLRMRRWYLGVAPLLPAAVFSVLSFQRSSFVALLLLFLATVVLSFAFSFGEKPVGLTVALRAAIKSRWALVGGIGVLVVAGVVLLLPLQLRNGGTHNSTGWTSLAQYLFASVGGLDARLVLGTWEFAPPVALDGTVGMVPGWGSYTFTNAVGILAKVGLPVWEAPFFYDYYSVPILGEEFSTNTATMLYDLYLDGGYGLVFAASAVATLATYLAQTTATVRARLIWLPLVAVVVAQTAWSFFTAEFTRDVRTIAMACFAAAVLAMWGAARASSGQPYLLLRPQEFWIRPRPMASNYKKLAGER